MEHLSPEGIRLLLEQPDQYTVHGRRDLALMSLMYDSGARVQEIVDLSVRGFHPRKQSCAGSYRKGQQNTAGSHHEEYSCACGSIYLRKQAGSGT